MLHNGNVVAFDNTALRRRRGWVQRGNKFVGYYRTRYGAWKGEIARRGDTFRVYIFKPPVAQLENHSRWICFHKTQGNKYRIYLALNPKDRDVDSIIFYVEQLICESFMTERNV